MVENRTSRKHNSIGHRLSCVLCPGSIDSRMKWLHKISLGMSLKSNTGIHSESITSERDVGKASADENYLPGEESQGIIADSGFRATAFTSCLPRRIFACPGEEQSIIDTISFVQKEKSKDGQEEKRFYTEKY